MTYSIPKKVNVPELFYQRFIAQLPFDNTASDPLNSLLTKLHTTEPTKRGRGLTRRVKDLTHGEWNELYALAADGRAHMKNADRETTLRPAICARVLADRMEVIGVDNPVEYVLRGSSKTTVTAPVAVQVPAPAVLPQAAPTVIVDQSVDVEEADEESLDFMYRDILGS